MGLPRAVKFHQEGNLQKAASEYERAYKQKDRNPTLYMNYGALLRNIGEVDKAESVYQEGVKHHPDHIGIINNYSNLVQESRTCFALAGYIKVLHARLNNNAPLKEVQNAYTNIAECFRRLGFNSLAKNTILSAIYRTGSCADLLRNLILLQEPSVLSRFLEPPGSSSDPFISNILDLIKECTPIKRAGIYFAIASFRLSNDEPEQALTLFRLALSSLEGLHSLSEEYNAEAQSLIDIHSWNFSCTLLKQQYFTEGWKLFEFGLRTPASGPQKWQRALKKPFTATQIPLWRGENLSGKHLFVMEEQGIGDGMMFLTLIPRLTNEAQKITILLSPRVYSIYIRSFDYLINAGKISILTPADLSRQSIQPNSFDYQIPLGSICQHRYCSISSYSNNIPVLKPNPDNTKLLRDKYLNEPLRNGKLPTELVGISWRGGGRPDRIKIKSIELEQFTEIMKSVPGARFVILQYGDCKAEHKYWSNLGLDVVYDRSINPLKDMNKWLDQVASCDSVLSVANTTIHAAGGLDIPTQCLLSLKSDWRWFDDDNVKRSYWYPSVGILRKDPNTGWKTAVSNAQQWLKSHAPYPSGPISTNVI